MLPAIPGKQFNTLSHGVVAAVQARRKRHDVLLVVNVVYAFFHTFGIIHAVTGGGPAKATEILVFKV